MMDNDYCQIKDMRMREIYGYGMILRRYRREENIILAVLIGIIIGFSVLIWWL